MTLEFRHCRRHHSVCKRGVQRRW